MPWPPARDLPNPGIEPRSCTLQADSLSAEPQGKPKNTGVGSLSLLQRIFLTQESNFGLLHCRQILYQLSYQGSPKFTASTLVRVNSVFSSVLFWVQCNLPQLLLLRSPGSAHTFLAAMPRSMWDFNSLTRDQTCTPCSGRMES